MAQLQYKTRGMSDYHGKAKVYFMCHSDDFLKYFESVADEILEKQNVAIWYEPNMHYYEENLPDNRTDEERKAEEQLHFENLAEMQLVVVPVTEKFIYQENKKIDADFAFAREHHIPMLPLLQETGIENAFSEKYGNLHLLAKNVKDDNAIDYEEKLQKYLELVLVGEEQAARIRKEFRGYVFLSYRKKDRRYAKQFINLLHKAESCREIGVWYDELLTPGEDFNDNIKNALIRSDLFALVVTPNLLEKGNYVLDTEYPEAVKAGKPIIPVNFMEVDERELQVGYVNIPKCINAEVEEIEKAFGKEMVSIPTIKKDVQGAEHDYLMGLAYLYGVDVEKDIELAEAYLKRAMAQGRIEAAKKLVEIWWEGIGVERVPDKAIAYQDLLLEMVTQRAYKEPCLENDLSRVEELLHLADMLREEGSLFLASDSYEMALELQSVIMDDYGVVSNLYRKACNGLSDILRREGDEERAEGYLKLSQSVSEKICAGLGDTASTIHLIKDYGNQAHMCRMQGDFVAARRYLLEALDLAENLLKKEATPEIDLLWSKIMIQAGDVFNAMGADGKEKFELALPVAKRVAEELKSQEAYYNLINCYGYLGDIAADNGLVLKAGDYYLEAVDLCMKLVREIGSARAYDSLASCEFRIAFVNKGCVDMMSLRKSLEIYEMLTKKYPEDASYAKACEMIRGVMPF